MPGKILIALLLFIAGCAGIPENIEPVKGFEVNRYLGKWYEIARLDHSFERGLTMVTAEYSLRDDGGIDVVNSGFDPRKKTWKKAFGKAYFTAGQDTGRFKVSFFWPFYGGYNIIELDKDKYSYALVCGPGKNYLWLLARQPKMEESTKARLIMKAKDLGFDTDRLIFVEH